MDSWNEIMDHGKETTLWENEGRRVFVTEQNQIGIELPDKTIVMTPEMWHEIVMEIGNKREVSR